MNKRLALLLFYMDYYAFFVRLRLYKVRVWWWDILEDTCKGIIIVLDKIIYRL